MDDKNTKNGRKLLEPTYDDNGNLIPLSQRFNSRNEDARFSVINRNTSIAELDSEYDSAYESGDTEEEMRIINEAAKRNGYAYRGYHHTEVDGELFTKFDLDKARNKLIADGYDGVIMTADYMGSEADEFCVFNPSQIKSAEPETYDDYGYVISPSKRFNYHDDIRFSVIQSEYDTEYRNAIEDYDNANGTELGKFIDDTINNSMQNPRRRYTIGTTGSILNKYGMFGDITIGKRAVSPRRHSNNEWHDLNMGEWLDAISTLNNPLYITKYKDGYRIYTPITMSNGRNICAGIDVNKVGRDLVVSDVVAMYGRNISSMISVGENILYDKEKQTIEKSSSAHNSQGYPQKSVSDRKDTTNNSNVQEKK